MTAPATGSWQPVLEPPEAERATEIARLVAQRALDEKTLKAAIDSMTTWEGDIPLIGWSSLSVAQGDAGHAVMCSYLDARWPEEGWDLAGREFLSRAAQAAQQTASPVNLYGGLTGLAFAAWCLSRDGTRYQNMLSSLDETLAPRVIELADEIGRLGPGHPMHHFDVVSGLAGVGAYLLCRRDHEPAAGALDAVVARVVDLVGEDDGVPRLFCAVEQLDPDMADLYPQGQVNLGLAHGLPGPLAFLALAMQAGIESDGLAEAIESGAAWLANHRTDDEWGINWSVAISLGDRDEPHEPSRAAWCYGAPGLARSLWLAGEALGRDDHRDLAVDAIEAILRRPHDARRIPSPTFCHGVAGLLQIVVRMAHDSGRPSLVEGSREVARELLDLHRPESLLGYVSEVTNDQFADEPGLLTGTPGIVLALSSASSDVEPFWDRFFLLS